jgi:Flp pilus assembly protein TadD
LLSRAVDLIAIMEKQPIASAAHQSNPRERRTMFLAIAVLLLAGFAAYHNSFSVPFLFDDQPTVLENPTIRQLWPISQLLAPPPGTTSGRPLVNVTLAINYALSGTKPWSYHAFNLLIHLLVALTLFGVVRRTLERARSQGVLSGSGTPVKAAPPPVAKQRAAPPLALSIAPWPGDSAFLALAVSLLWALHPLQTEAVTYVVQRTESLMGLFFLLTLYCFIRSIEAPRPRIWQGCAIAACLLGAATKEVIAMAPLLVLLYDRTFIAGSFAAAWRQRWRVHLALAFTWVILAAMVASTGWNRDGTSGFDIGIAPSAYWLTQFEAVARYLWLSFWPHPLVFEYGTFWVHRAADALPYALLVLPLAAATLVALWRRPVVGFLGAWFFGILAPTSIMPGRVQMIVEHRMYLPLAAVITLAVVGLHRLVGRRAFFAAAVLAVVLGGLTIRRNADYRSALSIWTDTAAKSPDNARALYGLGGALLQSGRPAEAIPYYERALQLDPNLPDYSLGNALLKVGRAADAIPIYERALRLNPNLADVCSDLAGALADVGRVPEAIQHYERALRLNPGFPDAHNNLGAVLYASGRVQDAIENYRQALQIRPDFPEAEYNLGLALFDTGRLGEAVAAFRVVVQRNPRLVAAWCSLGRALERSGQTAEAAASFEEALRRAPDSTEAREGLVRLRAAPR